MAAISRSLEQTTERKQSSHFTMRLSISLMDGEFIATLQYQHMELFQLLAFFHLAGAPLCSDPTYLIVRELGPPCGPGSMGVIMSLH
jgi:hypothetical protein